MSLKTEKDSNPCLIRLEESVTVNNASEMHGILVEAVRAARHVVLDFEHVSEVDVCGVQLLYAFRLAAEQAGLSVSAAGAIPEAVQLAFRETGLDPFNGPPDRSGK
jgi:anti-anti-sigma regulatory factor